MKFGQVVLKEMSYKDIPYLELWPFKGISYLELWQPFCSSEHNQLCKFGRGFYEVQFCEIILILGQWFRRRFRLKDFLSVALVALLFGRAKPFMQF